jgi:hypothetical protein
MVNIKSITLISTINQIYHFESISEYEKWLIDSYEAPSDKTKILLLLDGVFTPGERAFERKFNFQNGTLLGVYHILCTTTRIDAWLADADVQDILRQEHEAKLVINLKDHQRTSSIESANHCITTSTIVREPSLDRRNQTPPVIIVNKIIKDPAPPQTAPDG